MQKNAGLIFRFNYFQVRSDLGRNQEFSIPKLVLEFQLKPESFSMWEGYANDVSLHRFRKYVIKWRRMGPKNFTKSIFVQIRFCNFTFI